MGLVASKNPDWKRVFSEGRNFTRGHFCPQSGHLVRLAMKIGEVRFSTKIQTENEFFGKTNLRGLLRQNWATFSSGIILFPNAPYSELGPEKRYGAGFIKKFQPKTCFLGWTKLHSETLLPPIVPSSPFGQENRWGAIYYKNSNRKCILEKRIREDFWSKIEQCFRPEQFCPRMHHIANSAQKRGMGPVSSKNSNQKRVF